MIDWSDWQQMPDYRKENRHSSVIGELARTFDPMTYIPGVKEVANPIHDVATQGITLGNQLISPVIGKAVEFTNATNPLAKFLDEQTQVGGVTEFIKNKPLDAAGIVAGTFFSGGALGGAMGGGGALGGATGAASAAPAASTVGGAGGTAALQAASANAITPALAAPVTAGSTTGSLLSANAISPALASGTYGGAAGASGLGTLGTAGTAAANSMLPSTYGALVASQPSLWTQAKGLYDKFNSVDKYRSNLSKFSQNKDDPNREADAIAQRIISDPQDEIIKQIVMNRFRR